MDAFNIRDKVTKNYGDYIQSFIQIKDERIRDHVKNRLENGFLWPDPLIQINPAFEEGENVSELVESGLLHSECNKIFRRKPEPERDLGPICFYRHQVQGIKAAKAGENYILTTGTGSGKSLAYIVPIVDHVIRNGSGNGISAIIVYPMNALANSQERELRKFLCHGFPENKQLVTFQKYTGQEDKQTRELIWQNPPDILLTNFVMMELILTRHNERTIVNAARNLRFVVLDELHTYRGRQGADVALLVRRMKEALGSKNLIMVGTSATLAGEGSLEEQQKEIASVASNLFGSEVKPQNIIGESLARATQAMDLNDPGFIQNLRENIINVENNSSQSIQQFRINPLAIWIETKYGLEKDNSGRLKRCKPLPLYGDKGASSDLSKLTGIEIDVCENAIKKTLLAGAKLIKDDGNPVFAFRLHQFLSKGEAVFASLENEKERHLTVYRQKYVPEHRDRILLPLAFCRECGQEYYVVRREQQEDGRIVYKPRDLTDRLSSDHDDAGFLFLSSEFKWPDNIEEQITHIPDEWIEIRDGRKYIRPNRREYLPHKVYISKDGIEGEGDIEALWISSPFRFCLNCLISYGFRNESDYGKLSTLGSEGRATATTVLSLSAIRELRQDKELDDQARKLLSFTDNRQDASLQSGHFNDFVQASILRAALYAAVNKYGENGITHEEITHKVFEALNLPSFLYSQNPEARFAQRENTDKALREVLGYYIYRDLRRGWRVVAPNLEQCGLLKIEYVSLRDVCNDDSCWKQTHELLEKASSDIRYNICKTLLDFMRREMAIHVDYLKLEYQERIKQQSSQYLIDPWAISEEERLEKGRELYPGTKRRDVPIDAVFLSSRGGFGQFLRRSNTFAEAHIPSPTDCDNIIENLLQVLSSIGGILLEKNNGNNDSSYQLCASSMIWKAGDGKTGFYDPIRVPNMPEAGMRVNEFFRDFYKDEALKLIDYRAAEHTAQVPYDKRQEREQNFGKGKLPILYCSPTMELGVDIRDLNVVNMRNVPPTPANYAQRSGRAGRGGQPAFVFTYCAAGSPHDQYFFKRQELMVSGEVIPPRIDLSNEDLVRSHIHAIWLTEADLDLGQTLCDILDVVGDSPTLQFKPEIMEKINDLEARLRTKRVAQAILKTFQDTLDKADWFTDEWLDRVINGIHLSFDQDCERWRSLYRAAKEQVKIQTGITNDASRTRPDRDEAKRLRNEAETQLTILTDVKNVSQSDFYSYRYFASEGFLPGYNFPRLPISAYIPGRRSRKDDEFLSRPRFLAISEFGPRSIIYHEGSQYTINRVILPVSDDRSEGKLTRHAKLCDQCGYLHNQIDLTGIDNCENCGAHLPIPLNNMFRMQNVVTRRRDRITSDEEERTRLGYEIITAVKFNVIDGQLMKKTASLQSDRKLADFSYGHAATIWRINIGWKRRKNKNIHGFLLDMERGYWAKENQIESDDPEDPMSPVNQRVIPFVEDRRNCLLIQPSTNLDLPIMASLQDALKIALQAEYQVEDGELAAEPMPNAKNRRQILIYEASEGGAGILRHLVDDRNAVSRIAKTALELCHYDPITLKDLLHAPYTNEKCEAACYDCLLSYYNQKDHDILDRRLIKEILKQWMNAEVVVSPSGSTRSQHMTNLLKMTESELEKEWLGFIYDNNLRLPTHTQRLIPCCKTKPDFLYSEQNVAIYVDGSPHDNPDRQKRDAVQQECMEDHGYTVLRFHYRDNWEDIIRDNPNVFGIF